MKLSVHTKSIDQVSEHKLIGITITIDEKLAPLAESLSKMLSKNLYLLYKLQTICIQLQLLISNFKQAPSDKTCLDVFGKPQPHLIRLTCSRKYSIID
jgi:hypothetical protein